MPDNGTMEWSSLTRCKNQIGIWPVHSLAKSPFRLLGPLPFESVHHQTWKQHAPTSSLGFRLTGDPLPINALQVAPNVQVAAIDVFPPECRGFTDSTPYADERYPKRSQPMGSYFGNEHFKLPMIPHLFPLGVIRGFDDPIARVFRKPTPENREPERTVQYCVDLRWYSLHAFRSECRVQLLNMIGIDSRDTH